MMDTTLVQPEVISKWNKTYSQGSDKSYPNLDLVRLEKWFFKSKPGKLLEYAFGCGVNLIYLLEQGYDIEALDASSEAKKLVESKLARRPELQSRVRLTHVDVNTAKLPFEDAAFDYVNCISLLSLLGTKEKVEALLREFVRVMKPGAKIIVDINGPESDFARESEKLGNDVFVYRGAAKNEEPVRCYCPKNDEDFAAIVEKFFTIDDVGYSSHKYFHSEIQEFIICAHKNG